MKKRIPNYENYIIYDTGELLNETTGKMLNGSIRLNGYKQYRLSKNNEKISFYAHRLVAEAFLPNPYNLPIVNHKDGNKLNNNLENLEWVSYSENCEHAHQSGLISKRKKAEFYIEDLPDEKWVGKIGFPLYLISNYGRIRNRETGRILKPSIACGYYKIRLSNNGNVKDFMIHKLVYELFSGLRIPESCVIDHIDGNKLNNHIDNLRCITNSENVLAALYETKTNATAKSVNQYSLNGEYIQSFRSAREAAKQLELDSSTISKVCRGKNKTHGGFIFKYSDN